ncbi:MAG: hypothetical protein CVT60_03345 [Actinobacteria bacterium HGW-Actinobacteria-10]|jgi:GAF domain-containing protein|nr:MAG: hypothetical protein CVT60_03345 [Actinobacteria bacterium HGW-Actinobacteria-10]
MTDDLAHMEREQLRELIGVSALITSSLDAGEIRRRAVEAATRLVGAERASLLLIDGTGERMYFEVATGDDTDILSKVRMVPGQGIAGSVVQSCAAAVVNDVQSDPRYCRELDAQTDFVTRSMIAVPLSCRGNPLGVLEVINKRNGEFDEADLALVTSLGNHIAIAVENARLYSRLRRSFVEMAVYAALFAVVFVAVGFWIISLGR